MHKLSVRHIPIKISKRNNETAIIEKMKARIKKDPAVIEKFKEYDVPIEKIDDVDVQFADLDVSAKTKNEKIYLNRKMLCPDSNVKDPTSYLAHEIVHVLQQSTGNTEGHQVKDYLSKPTEQEAFQTQIEYKREHEGDREASRYIEELLDYHSKGGKERKEKKERLMDG